MLGARKRRRDMDHRRARPCPVPRRRHGDGDFTTPPCLNLASHGSITYRREAASRGQTAAAHAECSRLVARDHGGSAHGGRAGGGGFWGGVLAVPGFSRWGGRAS